VSQSTKRTSIGRSLLVIAPAAAPGAVGARRRLVSYRARGDREPIAANGAYMQPLLNIAVRAARRAGDLIVRSLDRSRELEVSVKQRNEFVTEVDRQAEQEIIGLIRGFHPDHAFLGEEGGAQGSSEMLWIIDPLDGTTNFLHGFPQFAVSIALKVRDRLELGVVYDPLRQELFTALRGSGAQLDGRRLRVSERRDLEDCLVGTGFPYREQARLDHYLDMFRAVTRRTRGIRRPGAAALDLAYVAAGRLDAFWELGLKEWDMAAGCLMIAEAGGMVTDLHGGARHLETGDVVGGNPRAHAALLRELSPFVPKA
jgi:myo-inositol-1(or 4)-monophosphatase